MKLQLVPEIRRHKQNGHWNEKKFDKTSWYDKLRVILVQMLSLVSTFRLVPKVETLKSDGSVK